MNRKIRKHSLLFLFILLLGMLLAACSSGQNSAGNLPAEETDKNPDATDSEADSSEKASGEDAEAKEPVSLGTFTMEDINGETYTESMFQDYTLTFVNVFATWCSPCISEIPDLEQLHQNMADKDVNVIGIVLDAADGEGGADPEALETAQLLAEETGASYPFLVPDAGLLNGLLTGVQAVPTSFFVDSEGNLVGNVYMGSKSLEDWTDIVNQELEALEAAQ